MASRYCHVASACNSSRLAKRGVVTDTQMMETIPAHDQLTDAAIVTLPVASAASGDYDSPWKEAIEQYFPAFIAFFFPDIHTDILPIRRTKSPKAEFLGGLSLESTAL